MGTIFLELAKCTTFTRFFWMNHSDLKKPHIQPIKPMTEQQFWQWLIEKAYEYRARAQNAQPPPTAPPQVKTIQPIV